MPVNLAELADPCHTAVLTMECQRGVVGDLSPLAEIRDAVAKKGSLLATGKLCQQARQTGAKVVHCVVENRPDRAGTAQNCRILAMAVRNTDAPLTAGSQAAQLVPELNCQPSDIISARSHGMTDNKGYIVIGAGQGMGRQTAHALSQVGAKVLCMDIEASRAEQVADEVDGEAFVGDATQREDIEQLASTAEDLLPGIDGFVDIIGMARWGGVLDINDEDWDWQFNMVLRHAYLASQILGRKMVAAGNGGTMVFIASVSALTAAPNHAAYGAGKPYSPL